MDTNQRFRFSDDYYESDEEQQKAYPNILDFEQSMQYVTNAFQDIRYACETLGV